MARFRRSAAPGGQDGGYQPWGDWRRITEADGYDNYNKWVEEVTGKPQDTYHHWVAPLENGHELHAWSYNHSPTQAALGWTWAVRDPRGDETGWDEDNPMWFAGGGPDSPVYDEDGDEEEDARYPDLGSAVRRAEEKYRQLFPVDGPGTGPHDSGVDYSDLNRFMGEL